MNSLEFVENVVSTYSVQNSTKCVENIPQKSMENKIPYVENLISHDLWKVSSGM